MNPCSRFASYLRAFFVLALLGSAWLAHGQITFYNPSTGPGGDFIADVNGDGIPDLLTKTGSVLLGNGDGTFRNGTSVSGGIVARGDFNGDGRVDVLQTGTGGPLNGTLLVLLGNGDGTFQSPITTFSQVLYLPIAGDVSGDGLADVVALGSTPNTLLVYLSQGNGTFAPGVAYTISNSSESHAITLGDFNGDHVVDIALTVTGQEEVLLGNGDGTFQTGKTSTGVANPEFPISGDFNNDGKLDLMLSGELLLGNGDGTFQSPTPVANGVAEAVGDFNGDGKLDIVVTPYITEICLGNGDGTFTNAYDYLEQGPFEGNPPGFPPQVADFNGDGRLDIAGTGPLLLGNGDGSFTGGLVTQPILATTAITGIFNQKETGFVDAAEVSGTNLYILSNDGKGNLTISNSYSLQEPGFGIASADLNGDGYPDLVVAGTDPNTGNWNYSVLLGNGDDTFQAPQFYPQSVAGAVRVQYSLVVADFNNDHKMDIAVGPVGNQSFAILLGNGDGTFASPAYVYDGGGNSNSTHLMAADFNGDGNIDVAASPLGSGNPGTALLFGNGDGTFQPASFALGNFTAMGTADFNKDGRADLWGEVELGCGVLLGNGDGTFAPQTPFSPQCLLPIVVSDINGDGILDMFADYFHPSHFQGGYSAYYAYLGNGDGTFSQAILSLTAGMDGYAPTFEFAVDMNGDGKPDIFSNAGSGYTYVLINTTVSAPVVTLSPTKLVFPPAPLGTTNGKQTVTLSNTGAVELKVTQIALNGANASEFGETNNCTKVEPNGTCTINVTFTPTVVGSATASLVVSDNAGNGSQSVALSGTGVAGENLITIGPAPGSPSSAQLVPGGSVLFMLAVTPTGSFSGTVDLACSVSPATPQAPTCAVPSSVEVGGGVSTNVQVTVRASQTTSAGLTAYGDFPQGTKPLTLTVFLLAASLLITNRRRRLAMVAPVWMALIVLASCGGGSSGNAGDIYSVAVTATSEGSTSKTTLTVIVN